MIFAHTVEKVLSGEKTQTRRVVHPPECVERDEDGNVIAIYLLTSNGNWREKWRVGKTYSVQARRGGPSVGRFLLKAIRTERLQDISPDDVRAEGCHDLEAFKTLWNGIHSRLPAWWDDFGAENPAPGVRWEDNPRVRVLVFEVPEGQEKV